MIWILYICVYVYITYTYIVCTCVCVNGCTCIYIHIYNTRECGSVGRSVGRSVLQYTHIYIIFQLTGLVRPLVGHERAEAGRSVPDCVHHGGVAVVSHPCIYTYVYMYICVHLATWVGRWWVSFLVGESTRKNDICMYVSPALRSGCSRCLRRRWWPLWSASPAM
jgi:hypothetical protein